MAKSTFAFTPAERVALETILRDVPEAVTTLEEGLAPVVGDLLETMQGLVVTEADVDRVLADLRTELVNRLLGESGHWGEQEAIREPVIDLVTRHLLAQARDNFVRRLLVPKRN